MKGFIAVILIVLGAIYGDAQLFTYQGYLRDGSMPANGSYNLAFKLFNASSSGVQVGSTITLNGTDVANGLFTVELNFGATAFPGADRWLEIAVNGTTLVPRVKVNAAPYATFSQNTRGISVDGSGNVGVGTTAPSAKLEVVGTARVSAFRMTPGAGAGKVLTSDANGMGTWQDAPALSLPFSGTGIAFPGDAVFKITNTSSGYALLGQSDGNGIGVAGLSTTTVGVNKGVYGMSASASGTGVYGEVTSATGSTYGGFFTSASQTGFGVYATTTALTGVSIAGSFWSQSTNGIGVSGYASASTGTTVGGLFQSDSTSGYGLISNAMATSGTTYAGYFYNTSTGGIGVYGKTTASTGNTFGGFFESDSSTGTGVMARTGQAGAIALQAINTAGGTAAQFIGNVGIGTATPTRPLHIASPEPVLNLQDTDSSTNQVGYISLRNNAGSETGFIGFGSPSSPAAHFFNNRAGGSIILGTSGIERMIIGAAGDVGIGTSVPGARLDVRVSTPFGLAGLFISSAAGADGLIGTSSASSGDGIGVRGITNSASGFGVFSTGRFSATGTKSFRIDHPFDPENKYLLHYCSEGMEPLNVYSGNVTTDHQGYATIELPGYFEEINRDFRYQLTVIDNSSDFILAKVTQEIQSNRFQIRTSKPNVKVSWRVESVRNDLFVRRYGAPVELNKPEHERGKYQHPELYDQPEEKGIHYHAEPAQPPDR